MNQFPAEINAWKNDVARRLVRLRGHINDIMMNLPMIPDPEIGMPFTGPLVPDPFVFPPTDRSGGTLVGTGGTTTVGGCPGASSMRAIFTITGSCGYEGDYNISKSFTSHVGTVCNWQTGGSGIGQYVYDTSTGVFRYIDAFGEYRASVVPPSHGNSVVLDLFNDASGGCTLPATITVTGQG